MTPARETTDTVTLQGAGTTSTSQAPPPEPAAQGTSVAAGVPAGSSAAPAGPSAVPAGSSAVPAGSSAAPAGSSAVPAPAARPPSAPQAAARKSPPPVIAILVDGPVNEGFRREGGPVHITGGRTMAYGEAVEESGGQVRWVWDDGRPPEVLLRGVDGVLVPGGRDVNPEVYGQTAKRHLGLNVAPMKFDLWQCDVMQAALDKKLPMRGICRGMQLLNVIGKGTLMQDITDHMDRPWQYRMHHTSASHPIAIIPNTGFGRAMREEALIVNSSHHQAVDALASGYQPVAVAADGIIEAMERVSDPTVMGVQFHPERLRPELRQRFFEAFIHDARARRGDSPSEIVVAPEPTTSFRPEAVSRTTTTFRAEVSPPKAGGPDNERRPVERAPAITLADLAYARSKATTAALAKLEGQGLGVYTAQGGKVRWDNLIQATRSEKPQRVQLRAEGASEPQMDIAANRLEDFLLSMIPEGRPHLSPPILNALRLIEEARGLAGPSATTADVFHRRSGWFGSAPVATDIEAVWAMQDGKLQMRFRDPQMKIERRLDIDSMKSLQHCTKQMREARGPR